MAGLSWVVNFANSVVGVGVLAMPYCFQQCGIVLAALMIIVSATLTKITCEFLLRSASYTRRSTFEQIAFHVYGQLGKLTTEISIMGLLIGTLVAFQVVIGDLAPAIVHNVLGIQESWTLRAIMMLGSAGLILPICLMRNVASLASLNAISMSFYMFFIFVILCFSIPTLYAMEWWSKVNFWRPVAFFKCLPIISIAFTCQTQVLVMYSALPDPDMKTMTEIINKAINLVAGIYITVGSFGYISFFKGGIHGDILENFPHGFFTDAIKFGFWISVVLSFPLIVFPVRAAINSMLYANKKQGVLHDVISSASDYIAPDKFTSITLALVFGTLVIGILIPNIEIVLSVTGALVGTFLCFVFPSALFLMSGAKDKQRKVAQMILVVSSIVMVISTMSVLSSINQVGPARPAHEAHKSGNNENIVKFVPHQKEIHVNNPNRRDETNEEGADSRNSDVGGVDVHNNNNNNNNNIVETKKIEEVNENERKPLVPMKPIQNINKDIISKDTEKEKVVIADSANRDKEDNKKDHVVTTKAVVMDDINKVGRKQLKVEELNDTKDEKKVEDNRAKLVVESKESEKKDSVKDDVKDVKPIQKEVNAPETIKKIDKNKNNSVLITTKPVLDTKISKNRMGNRDILGT